MRKLYAYSLLKTDFVGEETSEGLETDEGTSLLWKKNKKSKLLGVKVKIKKKKKNRAPVHTMKAYGGVEV